jgi:hypothetical protein
LHKEKEMLDSRKLLLAFVVVAILAAPASAQFVPPLSCFAQAAGTPSIRAEGVTELVGDIIIRCTGGDPTPAGVNLRQVNIQIFSSPSINITSRLLGGGFAEGMLFIDEFAPSLQTLCGNAEDTASALGEISDIYPYSIPAGSAQVRIEGVCGGHSGSPTSNGLGTYDPRVANTLANTWRGNAYQARRASANSLIWQGIPFDPPGTLTDRVLRITNVRVNASQLGVPAGSQASVAMVISTSASGVFNPIALPITNPAPTVAIALNSLAFSVRDFKSCLQCIDTNADFFDDPSEDLEEDDYCGYQYLELRYEELFPSVFRRRNQALPITNALDPTDDDTPISQDILGFPFQTESGFMKAAANGTRWPTIAENDTRVAGTSGGVVGLADHGTRLIARFNNVQNGIEIWVQNSVDVVSTQAVSTTDTGQAILTSTDPNGSGPFTPVTPGSDVFGGGLNQVGIIGGTGQAVWEILNADTTSIERVNIAVVFAWEANTTNNLPSLGTSTANGNLAPLSTTASASETAAIPRFVDGAVNRNLLTINSCRSNLLFPFVSNQAGFDTGLAIANTTKDPFGTALQTGACTINFYGYVGNSKVCLSFPSPSITGGEHFAWSLANGGAVTATAGFQGYVIAQCNFQYAHGYAFISDLGSQRLAQGYLALVLDDALTDRGDRTGSLSEVLGH